MIQQSASFTNRANNLANVLVNEVHIKTTSATVPNITKKYIAIWDTGAMATVITPNVVADLGLKPISYIQIATPSGKMNCGQYLVDLVLPQNVIVTDILVTEAIPADCDALIGMDVISLGDFAVTNFQGKTTFSFRVPSMQEIDFVVYRYSATKIQSPGRNETCPCGSGKKYKNCCGKSK